MSSDTDGHLSQLEAFLLHLPDCDSPDLNPPEWPIHSHPKEDAPPPPSPFEDYQRYPFHWTGESLKETPVALLTAARKKKDIERSALIAQFPLLQTSQMEERHALKPTASPKQSVRKRRFRHLRRAMSLTHIKHKPTPPVTAPPTPTIPSQLPSIGTKSLESLAHWQLPDPTGAPSPLDGNSIVWPSSLAPSHSAPRSPFLPPLDQLSPPSSIPSESDVLPPEALMGVGIPISLTVSPNASPAPSPRSIYPPSLYDTIDVSDIHTLEKDIVGKVIAGTPEGLVSYITSPDCLDYEVLSDFFLMYRKFLDPSKLLYLLCARFEWGLIRGAIVKPPDNEGMVRVRTFAALRHWLLNYFADDFAPSPSLQSQFVRSLNAFGKDPRVRGSTRDTKIVAELKRCWRRVCSIYWDVQERKSTFGGAEADITLGGQKSGVPSWQEGLVTRTRVPSLILRATKKREELLGVGASQSQPELRKRFMESGKTRTINSTRPAVPRKHTRTRSASSIQTSQDSRTRHRRNLSEEFSVLYSKNTSPSLFRSFARGDGRQEWPPVNVRTDLLVTTPTASTAPSSLHRQKRRFFRSKRKKIAAEGGLLSPGVSKTSLSMRISCTGHLSDDEDDKVSRVARNSLPAVPARHRVDFLAAGMWPSFVSASSMDSHVNRRQAEQLGEALVQGYLQPIKVDDESALEVAAAMDKGKAVEIVPPAEITVTSSEDPAFQRTLSMSEIERHLDATRPISTPSPRTPDSFQRHRANTRYSDRYSTAPSLPPPVKPPDPPVRGLRRRPGGNLRQFETVDELHPQRGGLGSTTSSMSSFSVGVIETTSHLEIPSVSMESRSLRSLLGLPQDGSAIYSPTGRKTGLAMDFSKFRPPDDMESSDDDNSDPIDAVEKTLMKLEGKYFRNKRRSLQPSDSDSQNGQTDRVSYEYAENSARTSNARSIDLPDSPPEEIMIEKSPEDVWRRRHRHVLDGQEFGTSSQIDPLADSSIYESIDEVDAEATSEFQESEAQDFYMQVPTLESAIAELERHQLESQQPRIPSVSPPRPPKSDHHSLSSHLPFILQYDSHLLARQFTLIEKDILAEMDWTELIEPTWMDHSPEMVDVRDWKGFITRGESESGLHSVIAHFNLMAGWTTSEVVLTQSIIERRMVISKLIHIAAACRQLCNFTTLTQIAVGLQSQHVSRLTRTWEALSVADLKLWQELKELVNSRKNWSKMRREMDNASIGPRRKGIFMSDIVHAGSRPLPSGKVDFEGLRLRASIVKRTLRLIELAEEYDFEPEEGVAERCLWITAFDEPMLRRLAGSLECN